MKPRISVIMKSRISVLIMFIITSLTALASVEIDGLYYDLDEESLTASVSGNGSCTGKVVIPSEVEYDGKTYSVTTIGYKAFYGCEELISIEIPSSVTNIGDFAFSGCSDLTSGEIPNSVINIGGGAFSECSSLKKLIIADGEEILNIGSSYPFMHTGLSEVYLGRNYIFDCPQSPLRGGLFSFLESLVEFSIGNRVTYIGENSFYQCTSLKKLIIADGEEDLRIEGSAFTGVDLSEIYLGRNISTTTNTGGTLDYPGRFFEKMPSFSVTIGESLTTIGQGAFYDCKGLTSVKISNSVKTIGELAFSGCGLESVEIPNSVTTIGHAAFYGCSSLASVSIPNSVTTIESMAFSGCGLESVEIPDSLVCIEREVFSYCRKLTSVVIPNSVTTIGKWAFSECGSLSSVEIPNSVTTIESYAFYKCSSISSVSIPNSMITIGKDAFEGCGNLKRAEFASIESICRINFENYYSNPLYYARHLYVEGEEITKLLIPDTFESIGNYTFENCLGLTSVEIPNSVTSIGGWAFVDCSSGLTSLEIPNSVTIIGQSAFNGCKGLTSINIPTSITSIGSSAFYGCDNLKDVYYGSLRPTNNADENIFDNSTYSTATLWVPQEAVELCQRISPWRNFYDIKAYDFTTGVEDIVFSSEEGYEEDSKDLTEVFTLDGVKVYEKPENLAPGVYVIRKGSETEKIMVK